MPAGHLGIPLAADFWQGNSHWISAALTLLAAIVLAFVVDRAFQRRGRRLADTLLRGEVSRGVDTRLRFVRRVTYAAILLIGVALALSQFAGINRLAASVLASGAIAAAILGFAARQTLANFVAGVMLAVTQPLRIGDWVSFEDGYGMVEDVRLNFTILRTASEQRIVIPNERLAGGILRNDTLAVDAIGVTVDIWLAPEADADQAVLALQEETGATVSVAESAATGVRLSVSGDRVPPPDKATREAELRARCLRRLRSEGLLPTCEGSPAGRRTHAAVVESGVRASAGRRSHESLATHPAPPSPGRSP
jgi:small-conductance mechanosensitive channel